MPSHGQDVVSHYWNAFCSLLISSSVSEMLNSILSQMCGRLYFPIFLLSVGLFTLMYIDSLIVLAKLLSSLPIILKFSKDVSWPLILWCWNIGGGPSSVPCTFAQKIFLIHQCTLPHSQIINTNIRRRRRPPEVNI